MIKSKPVSLFLISIFIQIGPICHGSPDIIDHGTKLADNDRSTATATLSPLWSFVISDSIYMYYASTGDRDIALQQITQVWEDALAPQVTDVQVVLISDHPAAVNITSVKGAQENIVTYAVLGNTEDPVPASTAKKYFRELIAETHIPVVPVNLTDVNNSSGSANAWSVNSFAILDSLWVEYASLAERDALLQRVKLLWLNVLFANASNVHMTLYSDDAVPNTNGSRHFVTYLITGESSTVVRDRDSKYRFRDILQSAYVVGITAGPLGGSSSTTTTSTTTPLPLEVSTVRLAPIDAQRFSILDTALLPYETLSQREVLLQQVKVLWLTVLGANIYDFNIRVVNATAQNDTNPTVYDVTYEISGWTKSNFNLQDVKNKFHLAIIKMQSLGGVDENRDVVSLGDQKPATGAPVLTVPVSTPATVTVSASASTNAPETPEDSNSSDALTSAQSKAAEALVRHTLSGINTTNLHFFIFYETIMLQFNNEADLNVAMEALRKFWIEVFGSSAEDILISVYQNATSSASGSSNSSVPVRNIDYVVMVLSKQPSVDIEAAKGRFRQLLTSSGASHLISKADFMSGTIPKFSNYVILDSVSVSFANRTEQGAFLAELRQLWKELLGSDAEDVNVAVYRIAPSVVVNPAENASVYDISYVVLVESRLPDLAVDDLKASVKDSITTLNVPGVTIYASAAVAPASNEISKQLGEQKSAAISGSAIDKKSAMDSQGPFLGVQLQDHVNLVYTTTDEENAQLESLRQIWISVLGPDAKDVRFRITNDTVISAGGRSVHLVFYQIFVVTSAASYDQQAVYDKFRHSLQMANFPFVVSSSESQNVATTTESSKDVAKIANYLKVTVPEPINAFILNDNIRLNLVHLGIQRALDFIAKLWVEILGPDMLDVQLRLSDDVRDPKTGLDDISYLMLILTKNKTLDLNATRANFYKSLSQKNYSFVIPYGDMPIDHLPKLRNANVVVIPAGISISFESKNELSIMLQIIKGLWQKLLGLNATSVDISIYKDDVSPDVQSDVSPNPVHDIAYVVLAHTDNNTFDIPALKSKFEALLPNEASVGWSAIIQIRSSPNLTHSLQLPEEKSALKPEELSAGLTLQDQVNLQYNTDVEQNEALEKLRQLWITILGSAAKDVHFRVVNDTLITINGRRVHWVLYKIFVVTTAATVYDPSALYNTFHHILQNNVKFSFVVPSPKNETSNLTEAAFGAIEFGLPLAYRFITSAKPEPAFMAKDEVRMNLPSRADVKKHGIELEQNLKVIRKLWMEFLGVGENDVQLWVYDNDEDHATGVHGVRYLMVILTNNRTLDVNRTRTDFHEVLSGKNYTFVAPFKNEGGVSKLQDDNVVAIPEGISLSYDSDDELSSVLDLIVRKLWRKALGSKASEVEIVWYKSKISQSVAPDANTKPVYDVSYVVLVHLANSTTTLDIPVLKTNFDALLQNLTMFDWSLIRENSTSSNSTDSLDTPAPEAKYAILDPKKKNLLEFPVVDNVYLQYSDDIERDDAFENLRQLWVMVLGPDAKQVRFRILNDTLANVSGRWVHWVYYIVSVQIAPASFNQHAAYEKFHQKLKDANLSFVISPPDTVVSSTISPTVKSSLPTDLTKSVKPDVSATTKSLPTTDSIRASSATEKLVVFASTKDPLQTEPTKSSSISVKTYVSSSTTKGPAITESTKTSTTVSISEKIAVVISSKSVPATESTKAFTSSVTRKPDVAGTTKSALPIESTKASSVSSGDSATTKNIIAQTEQAKLSAVNAKPDVSGATNSSVQAEASKSSSFMKISVPEPVNAFILNDNIRLNVSSKLEGEKALETITKLWIELLGSDTLDLQLRPYEDIQDQKSGLHDVTYILLILTKNHTWNLNISKTRANFHDLLGRKSFSFVVPYDKETWHSKLHNANLVVIPGGISISYASQDELNMMLQVIRTLWQTVLGASASRLDVSVYKDEVNPVLKSDISPYPVHDISYVVVIHADNNTLDIEALTKKFAELLPTGTIGWAKSKCTHSNVTSNSTDSIAAVVLPPLKAPELPAGLILADYIWLVYSNTSVRDDYLKQIEKVWEKVLADYNVTNVKIRYHHEDFDNSSSDRSDSHKVFYYVHGAAYGKQLDFAKIKRQFRKQLPIGNFLFGFDVEEGDEPSEDLSKINTNEEQNEHSEVMEEIVTNVQFSDSLILQYSDPDELDAELTEIKNVWDKTFGTSLISPTKIRVMKDTLQSTSAAFKPASVHQVEYTVEATAKDTDATIGNKTQQFYQAVRLAQFPFVLSKSQLSIPSIPIRSLPPGMSAGNVTVVNISPAAMKNAGFTFQNTSEIFQGFAFSPNVVPNANNNNNNTTLHRLKGAFMITYKNETDLQDNLQIIRNNWNNLVGLNQSVLNLTLIDDDHGKNLSNQSLANLPGHHLISYEISSSVDVDLLRVKGLLDHILSAYSFLLSTDSDEVKENGQKISKTSVIGSSDKNVKDRLFSWLDLTGAKEPGNNVILTGVNGSTNVMAFDFGPKIALKMKPKTEPLHVEVK